MGGVAPGSTVYTDGYPPFARIDEVGVTHIPRIQPRRSTLHRGAQSVVPLVDRAIGNLQQWLIGTYHGVSKAQLPDTIGRPVWRTWSFATKSIIEPGLRAPGAAAGGRPKALLGCNVLNRMTDRPRAASILQHRSLT